MDENIWKSFNYLLIKENFTIFSGVYRASFRSTFISQVEFSYDMKKALGLSLADRQKSPKAFSYVFIACCLNARIPPSDFPRFFRLKLLCFFLTLSISSDQANPHTQPEPQHRCNNWKIQVYNCLYSVAKHSCHAGQDIGILPISLHHCPAGTNQEHQVSQQSNRPYGQQILNVFIVRSIKNKACLFQHIPHKSSGCQNSKKVSGP